MARALLAADGLFVGSSSAMNCVGAVRAAQELGARAGMVGRRPALWWLPGGVSVPVERCAHLGPVAATVGWRSVGGRHGLRIPASDALFSLSATEQGPGTAS